MDDDPLLSVYSYVERAYVRLQAGDLLTRCLDESSSLPLQRFVEGLLLAGPQSLQALREVLAETSQRKVQVQDDIHQMFQDLDKSLKSYGVQLENNLLVTAVHMSTEIVLAMLRDQHLQDEQIQEHCVQMLKDGRDLEENLTTRLELLGEIETYLQDWIWGLAYQTVHQIRGSPKEATEPQAH